MSVIGIEKLEFGVENIPSCQKFLHDFGLKAASDNASLFTTLSGAEIQLFSHQDPNGMTVAFTISKQKTVELEVTAINQWGDIRRIDKPSPVYEKATPINVGHVVFFVDDLPSTEAFYCQKLGFQVSDRYIDRAVFLRTQINGCHHNLFLLKLPHRSSGLNHVAFTVRDIHEVIGGGLAMNRHQWSTFIGPGRHPISSAYFWYVNSPTGGAFEYYTNDDYLTDKWQPRELEHSLVSFTEWAVEGGLDYETRRQVKE
ncbi:VOC family protein [Providencia rettgeri]|uniref:VOC family protein n=1 Tax=Morganellaceae TaxID=1903414 RepID=UPI001B3858B5|nr:MULTISPECIES: VOC family protein [Providencia]MBQ0531495.1 VOC family protein [Providencia rettgeri]WOB85436.1 VOC family protein [Providencia sp. PROV040]